MKFLIDECLGKGMGLWLKNLGYDAISGQEVFKGFKDHELLAYSVREQRILITGDKDFGELVFRDKHPFYGVILFRLAYATPAELLTLLDNILKTQSAYLAGCFLLVSKNSVRIVKHQI